MFVTRLPRKPYSYLEREVCSSFQHFILCQVRFSCNCLEHVTKYYIIKILCDESDRISLGIPSIAMWNYKTCFFAIFNDALSAVVFM
jgi:hypothetical protein